MRTAETAGSDHHWLRQHDAGERGAKYAAHSQGVRQGGCECARDANLKYIILLLLLSLQQVPIYLGAVEPLNIGNIVADKRYFHGSDGFGDCLANDGLEHVPSFVKPQHAVVAIRELCQARPKQITLIMVGPLTNLALGYTMYGEQFGQDIKDVYIMGGNYQGVGNSSRAAEFNFHSDPEAAHAVLLKTPCPITILPWEPCTKDRFHIPIVSYN